MTAWKRILCACALLGAWLGASSALADRRTGLHQSLLIEDADDMFLFPNTLSRYRNRISLDYGGQATSGNAVLSLGLSEEATLAFALHRGDLIDPFGVSADPFGVIAPAALGDPPSIFSNVDGAPATMLDLMYARTAGAASAWGLRLGLGRGSQVSTVDDDDTGAEELFVSAQFGYGRGVRGETTQYDFGVAAHLGKGSQVDGGNAETSGMRFNLSSLLRMFFPVDGQLDLGVIGSLGIRRLSQRTDAAAGEPAASLLTLHAAAGVGPALRLGDAKVAGYALLRGRLDFEDPNSETEDDEATVLSTLLPALHVAVEVPLTDWLYVRSGAEYSFRTSSRWQSAGTSDLYEGQNDGVFAWNVGLGVVFEQLRFDGALSEGFVTGGPDFIGGTSPGFLAMASLTYSFDDARRGVSTPAGPNHAPPPPPPQVRPEPVAPAPPPPVMLQPQPQPLAPAPEVPPEERPAPSVLPQSRPAPSGVDAGASFKGSGSFKVGTP